MEVEPHNVKLSYTGRISLLVLAVSVLSFSSLVSSVLASSIDDRTTDDAAATTMSDDISLNVTTSNVELEEEPFAVGHYTQVSQNLVNETLPLQIVLEGSTTFTILPNTTETITTIDTGEAVITALPGGGVIRGHIQMMLEEGFESAIADFTEYFIDDAPTAISLLYFTTNSTGMLAPLNNTIAISLDEEQPNGDVIARFFEWEGSRVPSAIDRDNNNNNNSTIGG
jgi:hypothetical protein